MAEPLVRGRIVGVELDRPAQHRFGTLRLPQMVCNAAPADAQASARFGSSSIAFRYRRLSLVAIVGLPVRRP